VKRIFDQRYVRNMINSYQIHLLSNKYILKFCLFFILLYSLGVMAWGALTIVLSLAITVNIFTLMDIKRCSNAYRKSFYLWEAKE